MNPQKLRQIIEAALLTFDEPLSIDNLLKLFTDDGQGVTKYVRYLMKWKRIAQVGDTSSSR